MIAALIAGGIGGCGSEPRRDASEPEGDFPVEVTTAKFPARQRLAETVDLELAVENVGDEAISELAVTIYTGDEKASEPFNIRVDQEGLADPGRPVWILENGFPKLAGPADDVSDLDEAPTAGAETAQTDTFGFGSIAPGDTLAAVWRVTPVKAGTYTVHYEIAAGLYGKAKAVTADGSPVEGEFVVTITDEPPRARVNDAGKVETDR